MFSMNSSADLRFSRELITELEDRSTGKRKKKSERGEKKHPQETEEYYQII